MEQEIVKKLKKKKKLNIYYELLKCSDIDFAHETHSYTDSEVEWKSQWDIVFNRVQ